MANLVVENKIKKLENGLKQLIKEADAINPAGFGYIQQTAIRSFQKSCRGLAGFELGELKNAFEMNDI